MAPADGGDSMMAWQEACQKWKRRAEVVQFMSSQKSELGGRKRSPSGLGFAPSKLTVMRRTVLSASLPLGTKLQNSMQPNLGSKNRLSVP